MSAEVPAPVGRGRAPAGRGGGGGPAGHADRAHRHDALIGVPLGQKLIMWPARPWTASLTASPRVGWACTLRATSWTVRSHCWARVSSGSSSVTSGPIRCAPSSSPYLASLMILTKPVGSPRPCALPFAVNGNLATLTSIALLAGLRLGLAEAGDLRLAVRRPRDHHVVELHGLRVRRSSRPRRRPSPRPRARASASRSRRRWRRCAARWCGSGRRCRSRRARSARTPVFSRP